MHFTQYILNFTYGSNLQNKLVPLLSFPGLNSTSTLFGNTALTLGCSSLCSQKSLSSWWHGSTRWWKHSFEVLVDVDNTVWYHFCRFVRCQSLFVPRPKTCGVLDADLGTGEVTEVPHWTHYYPHRNRTETSLLSVFYLCDPLLL